MLPPALNTPRDAAGQIAGVRVGNRKVSSYTYNPDASLASAEEPGARLVKYEYDAMGRVNSVTDGAGGVTRYQYDQRNNLIAETNPLGGVTRTAPESVSLRDKLGVLSVWAGQRASHVPFPVRFTPSGLRLLLAGGLARCR